MPPLYRMPISYLILIIAAAAIGVGSFLRRGENRPAHVVSPSAPTAVVTVEKQIPVAAPAPEVAADGVLRTPEGLRRKVLVKDLHLVPMSEPKGGIEVGVPLDYFSIWFVRGDSDDGMLRIGPTAGPPLGWVAKDSVLEWDTRLMALPASAADRPLLLYREESCLLDSLAGRTCPKHRGSCPTEGELKLRGGLETTLGLPVLRSRSIPEPDGSSRTIFEVASLVFDRAPKVRPAEPPPDLQPFLRNVYIAFAVDTTKSMQSYIDAVRRTAAKLVADAAKRPDVVLHLGLVEYRDQSPVYGFTTKVVMPFADARAFQGALDHVEAAKKGDGSVDEAVLEGVAVALPRAENEPLGERQHLDWPPGRRGDLATKMLILLGDAPDHARDIVRAEELAETAKKSGITIASISIDREGDLSPDERSRYEAQWRTLAEGSYRPLDKAHDFRSALPPVELKLAEADRLAPRLQGLIDDRIEHARNLAALAQAEAENRLKEYVNGQGLTLSRIAPILEDFHKGEARPQARPDPVLNGRKAPSVRRGWIAERWGKTPMVTLAVLMSRDELEVLIEELTQFQRAAQGNARDLAELRLIGKAAATGETAFLAVDRGSQTFADHLARSTGLPPAREDSLLRRSQSDLLQADESTRAALDSQLRESLSKLIRRQNGSDWNDPKRTLSGMALVPYDAVAF